MEKKSNLYDEIIKISIVGDAGNGKSSLMKRFINNEFSENSSTTMGIDCAFKTVSINIVNNNNGNDESLLNNSENKKIKIKIWDTAGQEKFGEIIRSCYRDSDGIIITYDTTNYQSFLNLEKWVQKVYNIIDPENITIVIAGTKSDLINSKEVPDDKIFEFVHANNFKYIEVSAKESKNIDVLFDMITKTILSKTKNKANNFIEKITFKNTNINHKNKEIENNNILNWCSFI